MREYNVIAQMVNLLRLPGRDLEAYIKQIRRIPVLSDDAVTDLSTLVQRGKAARQELEEALARYGSIDRIPKRLKLSQTIQGLTTDIAVGDEAQIRLVFHNLRLAHWAALVSVQRWGSADPAVRLKRRLDEEPEVKPEIKNRLKWLAFDRLPLEDRVQECTLALIKAAYDFHPGRAKFSTYAMLVMYQRLRRAVLRERYRDALGPGEADSMARTMQALRGLEKRMGRPPTLELVAADTDQGVKAVGYRLAEAAVMPRENLEEVLERLDVVDPETGVIRSAKDRICDEDAPNGPQVMYWTELGDSLQLVLETLSEREAGVIRLRFGIVDGIPRTLDEIGQVYGVTRERVRQLESKAMGKLQDTSRRRVLRAFLDGPPDCRG